MIAKIISFLPIIFVLMNKILGISRPVFLSDFQVSHPLIYSIFGFVFIIIYIFALIFLFDSEDKKNNNDILCLISLPIVFYLLFNLLSLNVPKFISNFSFSHPLIFSILIGIFVGFYLLMIASVAVSVIEDKQHASSKIGFALIPIISIALLYLFNIGVPPFIINFYDNHKVWFFIVFGIIALSYISVLFNLISFNNASRVAFVFIIASIVFIFMFRNDILFFNNELYSESYAVNSLENNETISNTETIDEYSTTNIKNIIKDNLYEILISLAVLSVILVILFIIRFIDNSRNGVNIIYTKDGDTFTLKGKKNNFIITKNGKYSFLVKDGITVAYKPAFKLFEKFKFYSSNGGK